MNFREEFNLSIRARCAVLYVTTREEERLLSVVKDCAAELENMRVVSWDFASGFDVGVAVGKGNPIAVLDFIAKEPADTPILYVLKDFHRFLEDNMVCRMVKNLAAQLKPQQKSILIVSPVYKVPEELTSSVSVLEFQLPTLPELREYITNITQNVVVDMDEEGFEQFVRAFQGLTISTVKTILSKALARSGKITLNDLQLVLEEKKQVIRKTQVLEFFNAEETMGSIGGMDVLKSWIVTRGMAFSEQAQQFGLPYPKGVLIVYASMYGNTENAAQALATSLCDKGMSKVAMYDVSSTHVSQLISEAFKYSHIVLASVTYNLGIYPAMHDFLMDMKALNLQNRTFAIIENGSWAVKSGDLMQKFVNDELKNMTVLNERLSLASSMGTDKRTELEALADAILESMK